MSNLNIGNFTEQCVQESKYALDYRRGRVPAWQENEDLYYLKPQPTIKGRSNYVLPLMPKYVDTLLSKIDDNPMIEFIAVEDADKIKAKKCTKAWKYDASPVRGNWNFKDLLGKKQNILYGRTIANYMSYVKSGKYYSDFNIVDVYDFLVDPRVGGVDLENASYLGIDNIFLDKSYFYKNPQRNELFLMDNVKEIFNSISKDQIHDYDNKFHEKENRYQALDLDFKTYNYKSDKFAKFRGWYSTINGIRYFILFNPETELAVRVVKLDIPFKTPNPNTGLPYWPFASWACNADQFEFWTPSPADRIRENIKIESVLINQAIDNRNFQNYGMVGVDKNAISNLALLKPRPQGIVPIDVPKGDSIQSKLFQFAYPGLGDTVNLYNLLEDLNAKESGMTEEAQGGTRASKKATVYMGDMQQVADRLGLKNKFYKSYYERLGILYSFGLKDNYTEKTAINVLGEDGAEMVKLLKEDTMPSFDIDVRGTQAEANDEIMLNEKKSTILASLMNIGKINVDEATKYLLEEAKFSSDEVQRLLELHGKGSVESIVKAKEENQKMTKGEEVKPDPTAMPIHIKTHINYVRDNKVKPKVADRILAHAQSEMPIAIKNVARDIQQKEFDLLLINPQQYAGETTDKPIEKKAVEGGTDKPVGGSVSIGSARSAGQRVAGNL